MTTLSAGDIAIVGYNSEKPLTADTQSTSIDGISFVLFRAIDAGTEIKFTDTEWAGSNLVAGEGAISWTATTALSAGTVVRIETGAATTGTHTANTGTVVDEVDNAFLGIGSYSYSSAGDQIIAYQGTAGGAITPITAFTNRPAGFVATASGSDSELPTGLVLGQTALHFVDTSGAAPDEFDNGYYTGPTSGSEAFLRTAIHTPSNWAGSNDPIAFDLSPGSFTIGGAATPAEILINNGGGEIVDGDSTPSAAEGTVFAAAEVTGGQTTQTYTINNTGGTTLNISGVTVSGADSGDFTVSTPPPASIAPAGSATFQVTFDPTAAGTRTATITVANDDADEGSYSFDVTGNGSLATGGTVLGAGDVAFVGFNSDNDEFGFVLLADIVAGTVIKFTDMGWTGTAWRNASEGVVQWTAPTDFTAGAVVIHDTSLPTYDRDFQQSTEGGFAAFNFAPSSGGDTITAFQGTLSASTATSTNLASLHYDGSEYDLTSTASSDSAVPFGLTDGVNAISFGADATTDFNSGIWIESTQASIADLRAAINNDTNWSGTDATGGQTIPTGPFATGPLVPDIDVQGAAISIVDGDTTPSDTDATSFGAVDVSAGTSSQTFTIRNAGGADLTLGTLSVSGDDAGDFVITPPGTSTIPAGTSLTFSVVFDASAAGLREAVVNIPSDDPDEPAFSFAVNGSGRAAGGGTTLAAGDIAFTGFNAAAPEGFTFVLLTDVVAGTSIKFTDAGWTGTTFRTTSEGMLEWIAPTAISAGTVIEVASDSGAVATDPTINAQDDGGHFGSTFSLSTSGDQLIAYQGTATATGTGITNLTAVQFEGTEWDTVYVDSTGSSLVPGGLTDGVNAISLGRGPVGTSSSETETATYNGPLSGALGDLKAALNNEANWTLSATSVPLSTTAFTIGAAPTGTLPPSVAGTEDILSILDLSGIVISDADASGDMTVRISAAEGTLSTIASPLVTGGGTSTITVTGSLAEVNGFFATSGAVSYLSAPDDFGLPGDTLSVVLNDLDGTGDVTLGTVAVFVLPVNDPPTATGLPTDAAVLEETPGNLDLSGVTLADVDEAGAQTLTLTASDGTLSAADAGGVTVGGTGTAVLTLTGAIAALNAYLANAAAVQFTGALDVIGDNAATVALTLDDGSGDVALGTVNMDIADLVDVQAGTAADNVLIGTTGADVIAGDAGNDVLIGLDGNDTLGGDDGNDAVLGGAGADVLTGGDGSDWLLYNGSDAAILGNLTANGLGVQNVSGGHAEGDLVSGFEKLRGSDFADVLTGGFGNDVLRGDGGADTINGGVGVDWVMYKGSGTGVTVDLGANTASGGDATGDVISNIENIDGSSFDDDLTGDAGVNVLRGGAGADTLDGGDGLDWAVYSGTGSAVTIDLGAGTASGGDAAGDVLSNIENLRGTVLDDVLIGDGGVNMLFGDAGDDTITGGDGDDVLRGGAGADSLDGGAGLDWVTYNTSDLAVTVELGGTATGGHATGDSLTGVENLRGSAFADGLTGDAGDNLLFGDAGDDTITGGDGDDVVRGGVGADSLDGGAGSDWLLYNSSTTGVTVDLSGASSASGGDATGDTITGFENLRGSAAGDSLTGDGARNFLFGDAGDDTISGGDGNDVLRGDAGADSFVFDSALGAGNLDRITDFVSAEDVMALDSAVFAGLTAGTLDAAAFLASADGLATTADHRVLYNTTTGLVSFDGDGNGAGAATGFVRLDTLPTLDAGDFLVI
ncbi:choice-of-anchor D domain-containing protein [Sulfitobacter albidus]|uniref:Choice-of-anchor D domain-containing protein n=1 Tax=Sulfitobacter albidus TaxID=2829501 RepID=A0A975PMV6_9RHOB|nr:choice-of-anchor D domain-containing protein [Sulfitobacter albidus]QUJ77208.1 choice-of-anchor D domain-containing protein [Sulfitobacter albidus]